VAGTVAALRAECAGVRELTEEEDGVPRLAALYGALLHGRRLPRAGWGAAAALGSPWHFCGFAARDAGGCADEGCGCRAAAAEAAAASLGNPRAAAAHAATWLVRALHGRLLRIGAAVRAGSDPRTTQRAADTDDALAARLRLLQLVPVADALAVASCTGAAADGAAAGAAAAAPLARRPAAHPLNLPDIVAVLAHLNYDSDSSVVLGCGLGRLLSKLVPCRCLFRGFADAVALECRKEAAVAVVLIRAVHTSLAGAVPGVPRPAIDPPFAALFDLERGALRTAPPDVEGFLAWVVRYPHVVFYCMKEVMCFYISLLPGLRQCLHEGAGDWPCFEKSVHRTCEGVRAMCAAQGWPAGLRAAEARLANQTGTTTYAHKLYKYSFDETVVRACDALRPPPAHADDVGAVAYVCARLSRAGLARHRAALEQVVGCSPAARALAAELRAVFVDVGYTPTQLRALIAHVPPADIARLAALSGVLEDLRSTDALPTDSGTMELQLAALCARTGRDDERRLQPADGCVYFCWACGEKGRKWRTPEEHAHNLHAIGAHEAYVDVGGALRCNRKGAACEGQRLVRVSLVGRWFKYAQRWYTLCPVCAAPCSYDMRRSTRGATISCGRCLEESDRIVAADAKKRELGTRAAVVRDWTRGEDACWYCCAALSVPQPGRGAAPTERIVMRVRRDLPHAGVTEVTLCSWCAHTKASRISPPVCKLGLTEGKLLAFMQRHSRVVYR
jgi:hypothetical protein